MIKIIQVAICLLAINACASNSNKSKMKEQVKQEIAGGYSDSATMSAEVQAMFDKAVKSVKDYTDIKPLSVTTQIVAGTNYKFSCSAKDKDGKSVKGEIVIFKPLPNENKEPLVTAVNF